MCFTFKKNNKQTKKPINCFLQDNASAGIWSLQTSTEIKLCRKTQIYSVCFWILLWTPKRKLISKPFKLWKITCNNQARISDCNTIQTDDNILQTKHIVCSQTSCAVLSHSFTDCKCAWGSTFFV